MLTYLARALVLASLLVVMNAATAFADGNGGTPAQAPSAATPIRAATVPGPVAIVDSKGMAHPPESAPLAVKAAIWAGNELQHKPYVWGGGHGAWKARGYDCSGSVSYVLHAGGLLNTPLTSGALMRFGAKGKGQWISIYASGSHAFVYLAGLRLDTGGGGTRGPRWRTGPRWERGFTVRHPAGL